MLIDLDGTPDFFHLSPFMRSKRDEWTCSVTIVSGGEGQRGSYLCDRLGREEVRDMEEPLRMNTKKQRPHLAHKSLCGVCFFVCNLELNLVKKQNQTTTADMN